MKIALMNVYSEPYGDRRTGGLNNFRNLLITIWIYTCCIW